MKKYVSTLIVSLALAFAALAGTAGAAGSAAFILTPASGSEEINTIFSVGIYENGSNVNVVTANMTYDPSKLQFAGISASGSAFGNDASSGGSGGSISITRYVSPGSPAVSGTQKIASVSFKVLTGSGTTSLVFAGGSHIASGGTDEWNGSTAGGSYTLTSPVVAPPPVSTGGGTGNTSQTGSTSPGTRIASQSSAPQQSSTSSDTPSASNKTLSASTAKTGSRNSNRKNTPESSASKPQDKKGSELLSIAPIVDAAIVGVGYSAYRRRGEAATILAGWYKLIRSASLRPVGKK
jgi:hypothetical protein